MSLKTDFKDAIPAAGAGTARKYKMVDNGDGTVSFQDATEYSQTGDKAQASVFNTTNAEVNAHTADPDIHVTAAQKEAWTGKAEHSTVTAATLSASDWTGSDAPYSQTIDVTGAKPEPTRIEVQPSPDATAEQWEAWRSALIRGGGQDTGTITLLADGDKPEIDIPITVTVRGDVS